MSIDDILINEAKEKELFESMEYMGAKREEIIAYKEVVISNALYKISLRAFELKH